MAAALTKHGFRWVQRFEAGDTQLREEIYLALDDSCAARYIHDHFVEVNVLELEADDHQSIGRWKEILSQELELFDDLWLVDLARRQDIVSRSFGIRGLAATQRNFWISAYEVIEDALRDPRPDVRKIALLSISRLAWLDFAAMLEPCVDTEKDPDIQAEMRQLLQDLKTHGKRAPGAFDW